MSREIVHAGRRIRVGVDTLVGPNGETIRRDVVLHPGAVVILPILSREHIVLIRNHRFAVDETLWEVPAGTVEPNEPLLECAKRELTEETGYTATKWTAKGYIYASPGVLDEKLHLFFAEGLTPGAQKLEADETIEPITVKLSKAIEMVLSGEIKDAKTVTSLLLWERIVSMPL